MGIVCNFKKASRHTLSVFRFPFSEKFVTYCSLRVKHNNKMLHARDTQVLNQFNSTYDVCSIGIEWQASHTNDHLAISTQKRLRLAVASLKKLIRN